MQVIPGAWYLGRIGPIPFYASNQALWLVLLVGVFTGFDVYQMAMALLVLVGSIVLHEYGHGFAALSVKQRPQCIILHALGGVCYTQRDGEQHPLKDIWVLIAGPLVNLLLMGVAMLAGWAIVTYEPAWLIEHDKFYVVGDLLSYMYGINLVLMIFNLFPIFPLDGGQITFHTLRLFGMPLPKVKKLCFYISVVVGIGALLYFHIGEPFSAMRLFYHLFMLGFLLRFAHAHLYASQR